MFCIGNFFTEIMQNELDTIRVSPLRFTLFNVLFHFDY